MKKYWIYIICIFCIIFIFFMVKFFHRAHIVDYSKDGYSIHEDFSIIDHQHTYNFIMNRGKENYIFSIYKNLSKKKKVIQNVQFYQEGNIACILPKIKKLKTSNLICLRDYNQVSNAVLVDDVNYKKIKEAASKYLVSDLEEKEPVLYENLEVYSHHILENEIYYIWNYKGIYILTKDNISYQEMIDNDLYDNIMATVVDKNYVLFLNNSSSGIDTIYTYNPNSKKVQMIKLDYKLEKDSYINGVYNHLIYVTDRKKKLQYTINIFKKEMEIIGNEEDLYVTYQRGEFIKLNKSDFFMKTWLFHNSHLRNDDLDIDDCIYHNSYDYCLKDDNFTMNKNQYSSNLFSLSNVTEWGLYYDQMLILQEDSLYAFDPIYGLRKILEYRELHYNYANIYQLGK